MEGCIVFRDDKAGSCVSVVSLCVILGFEGEKKRENKREGEKK